MPSGLDGPSSPVSLGQRPGLSHDGRTDLGYGTSKEKFHSSRKKGSSFPYEEPFDDEDLDLGLTADELEKISNKISTPFKSSDFLIGRSVDRVTVANGNHPIALGEASGVSLVPFPGMYKKRLQVGGGVNSPKLVSPGQYNRTGTDRGWSHAPIPLDTEPKGDDDLSPDEKNLEKIKDIVKSILRANSKEA
tara:strand:+ start:63 stop:635 length:573 start_codon:yes stop_codon:yes gene_type:complete